MHTETDLNVTAQTESVSSEQEHDGGVHGEEEPETKRWSRRTETV